VLDVNGTRTHLLLGRDDWAAPLAREPRAAWDAVRGMVTLRPSAHAFPLPAADRIPTLGDRRGAVTDTGGTVYFVAPERDALHAQLASDGATIRLWPPAAPPERESTGFAACAAPRPLTERLSGLALTRGGLLVAGTLAPAGLLVLDLRRGGLARRVRWPADVPFAPWDIAATPDGGVVVLDRDNARLWRLDRAFGVAADPGAAPEPAFEPASTAPRHRPPAEGDALAVDPKAVAVEVTDDGAVLLIVRPAELHVLRAGAPAQVHVLPGPRPVVAHDAALDADGALLIADGEGNQVWQYTLGAAPALEPRFFPLRRFGGRGLASGRGGVRYDSVNGWVPLVCRPRPVHAPAARVTTPVLDGREVACVWHRVRVDADVPPGCAVRVESVAAEAPELLAGDDDPVALDALDWHAEPAPVRRGEAAGAAWERTGVPAHETLLQHATGRYCRVRLTLEGDGRATPRVRSLRVTYPRFSYLHRYLPPAYREDPGPASFLDRWLANPEGLLSELEDKIARAELLFAPDSAPADTLAWLAGWLDLSLDPAWDERRSRLFLRHAASLLSMRGTPRGIQVALRLATDPGVDERGLVDPRDPRTAAIRIIEAFHLRHGSAIAAGDASGAAGAGPARLWRPALGAADLHARWRSATGRDEPFPPAPAVVTAEWERFCDAHLGYRPGTGPGDTARWRAFLARRHVRPAGGESLPAALPDGGAALEDWHDFGAVVLGSRRRAHRFSVLLPVCADTFGQSEDEAAERKRVAERVVALHKPAHTVFDVRFYWSAFRVGAARLGVDSALGDGPTWSRRLRLGAGELGASALGGPLSHLDAGPCCTATPETTP
jgi:phage tail-like protein